MSTNIRSIEVQGPEKASPEVLARVAATTFAQHAGFLGKGRPLVRSQCLLSTTEKRIYNVTVRKGDMDIVVILLRVWPPDPWNVGSVSLTQYPHTLSRVVAFATPLTITWEGDTPTLAMGLLETGGEE